MRLLQLNIIERMKLEWILISAGSYEKSFAWKIKRIKLCNEYIERHGQNWLISFELGNSYAEMEEYVDAVETFEKCYKMKPKKPLIIYCLSSIYRALAKASYLESDQRIMQSNSLYKTFCGFSVHPDKCKNAIQDLQIDQRIVLERFFECSFAVKRILGNRLDFKECRLIEQCIQAVKTEYRISDDDFSTKFNRGYLQSILKR
ncbi:MAG: hypothetical protein GYA60_06330 [Candidatus Methanofastidiosa archaeon]|jgi:tetratricopeptide (TPR) repeat protein|nr:hypothetical protein [Candidatus Methanofastidiosa archaeon]